MDDSDVSGCQLGDEDWINLVPPSQFLTEYSFFTDPTYGLTAISIIRIKKDGKFADINLACLGNITGFEDVDGSGGKYQVAHVYLSRRGAGITKKCETSQHYANSDNPFGLIVWGTDSFASYGYAAGGGLKSLNTVTIPVIK